MDRIVASRLRKLQVEEISRRFLSTGNPNFGRNEISRPFKGKCMPPLNIPLQEIHMSTPLADLIEPAKTQITTLPNGFKIASESSPIPCACIGLYVNCGSVNETPESSGSTHLLERMAFKSTKNRSHFSLVREVEAIGGSVSCSASREQMGYTFEALKTYLPEMVEMLIDSVRNPVFSEQEVKEQLTKVTSEIADISKNPESLLTEGLHSAGYSGGLRNPLLAPESALSRLNVTVLEEFFAENYTAPRMVLAAYGVEHEHLLSLAEPLLSDLPKVSVPEEPTSNYVGGDYRCQADSDTGHVALAFEVPGGWSNDKDAITLTILQTLMGGGGSFSAGGPGKGMYSRLYLRVLNEFHQVQSFTAFNSMYNNTGLFGIQASTGSQFMPHVVELAAREFLAIATPGEVSEVELDRAKNSTKSAVLMNLESRGLITEDIGRQILTYGQRKSVEYFLDVLDEITLDDITAIASKIVATPLTMASWGNVSNVPSYDQVTSVFK